MQRTGANGRRRIGLDIICLSLLILLILIDQVSKVICKNSFDNSSWFCTEVIAGFFDLRYAFNTGSAWSFLADVEWGQTFFKILTVFALIAFICFYIYVCKKGYKFLRIGVIFIIAGTLGNFIDRIVYNGVVDFLSFTLIGGYKFPIFNFADTFLTVGLIMAIIHYFFMDENCIFSKNNDK